MRIACLVLSYNRPRMLREALATCMDCDQLIVTDDGSDFNVEALVRGCRPNAQFVISQPISVQERLVTPRLGRLINTALSLVTCDVVTYLCDDDLFDPGWVDAVRAWFETHPFEHWTRGAWYQFQDGEAPGTAPCPLDARQLTTGNFAHRMTCYHECGIRWDERTIACHDNHFLQQVDRVHDTHAIPDCGAVAGWRRLHAHNALPYAVNAGYGANAAELFADKWLES